MNIITKIKLDDVLSDKTKTKYNVNNLLPAEDYTNVLAWSNTKNWIHEFHNDIPVIEITNKNEIRWIYEASKIGSVSGEFSSLHAEELDDLCKKYDKHNELMKDGVFIRTEHVSLKTGKHGIGPYYNIKQVIESICTSTYGHAAIRSNDTVLNIYIIPWLNLDINKEFRIFVHDNIITGISVQYIYERNEWLDSRSEGEIRSLVDGIRTYFNEVFLEKWHRTKMSENTKNFTMDLVILNEEYYFIEPNPFGAQYAAGSSLFHWIRDNDQLCNKKDTVEFRYIDSESTSN